MIDDEASKHMIASHGCEPPNQMRMGSAKLRMECESNNNKMDFEQHQDNVTNKSFQHPSKSAVKMDTASHSVYHEPTIIDEKPPKQPKQMLPQSTTVQPILSPQIPQQPTETQSYQQPSVFSANQSHPPENSYNLDNASSR